MSLKSIAIKLLKQVVADFGGQTIGPLSAEDILRLETQRSVITKFLADDDSRSKFQSAAGKLGTLRALLDQKAFQPTQTYELQCMGVVLGDAFVQEMGMEWVIVEDKHGSDPAVRLPGTSVLIYPITMISRRVEQRQTVDVFDLFNGVADEIEILRNPADKAK